MPAFAFGALLWGVGCSDSSTSSAGSPPPDAQDGHDRIAGDASGNQAGGGYQGEGGAGGTSAPSGVDSGGPIVPPPGGATRYPADRRQSPLTDAVVANLKKIISAHPDRDPHVVSKFGDVNCATPGTTFFWGCLDPNTHASITWGDQPDLSSTVSFFAMGRIGADSIFVHDDFATSCKEAGVVNGAFTADPKHPPNGFDYELNLAHPRFALVTYGIGETALSSISDYGERWWQDELEVIDHLIDNGTIPIVFSAPMTSSTDGTPSPKQLARTTDAILRGLAEGRQVPFVSRYVALLKSPAPAIGPGGHMLSYAAAGDNGTHCSLQIPQPTACTFTDDALTCSYNMSVYTAVEALDRLKHVVIDNQPALDQNPSPGRVGDGTATHPFEVDELPYTQMTDLADASDLSISDYSGCGGGSDEMGTAHIYHLKVMQMTPARYFAINRKGNARALVVHHFVGGLSKAQCSESTTTNGGFAKGTKLAPGDHYFVIDSKDAAGSSQVLFGIVPCDLGDKSC